MQVGLLQELALWRTLASCLHRRVSLSCCLHASLRATSSAVVTWWSRLPVSDLLSLKKKPSPRRSLQRVVASLPVLLGISKENDCKTHDSRVSSIAHRKMHTKSMKHTPETPGKNLLARSLGPRFVWRQALLAGAGHSVHMSQNLW